jgi:hypothetical protein
VRSPVFLCPAYEHAAPKTSSGEERVALLVNQDVDPEPGLMVRPFGYPARAGAPTRNPLKLPAFRRSVPPRKSFRSPTPTRETARPRTTHGGRNCPTDPPTGEPAMSCISTAARGVSKCRKNGALGHCSSQWVAARTRKPCPCISFHCLCSNQDALPASPPHRLIAGALTANAQTGTELWRFVTPEPILASPTLGPDGTVYIGSYDRKIYALARMEKSCGRPCCPNPRTSTGQPTPGIRNARGGSGRHNLRAF